MVCEPMKPGRRVLARSIGFRGESYTMSVVELTPQLQVTVTPYSEELHSTIYFDGHIDVEERAADDGAKMVVLLYEPTAMTPWRLMD